MTRTTYCNTIPKWAREVGEECFTCPYLLTTIQIQVSAEPLFQSITSKEESVASTFPTRIFRYFFFFFYPLQWNKKNNPRLLSYLVHLYFCFSPKASKERFLLHSSSSRHSFIIRLFFWPFFFLAVAACIRFFLIPCSTLAFEASFFFLVRTYCTKTYQLIPSSPNQRANVNGYISIAYATDI